MRKENNIKEGNEDFERKKSLIEMQKQADQIKHKLKMEELHFERASATLMHEQILERGRISRAEERKMLLEKTRAFKSR